MSEFVSDPVGRRMLASCRGAYTSHGFVYADGVAGVVVVAGGDADIMVGVYADDEAVGYGTPFLLRSWDDGPDAFGEAWAIVEAFTGTGLVWLSVDGVTECATVADVWFVDDEAWLTVWLRGDASVEWECRRTDVSFGVPAVGVRS